MATMRWTALVLAIGPALLMGACSREEASEAPEETFDIVYGDDNSTYAGNGHCEDPRFAGHVDQSELALGHDAEDCNPDTATSKQPMPYRPMFRAASASEIDYGDDDGPSAKDGECQDLRFAERGSAGGLHEVANLAHDATDCRKGVEDGTIEWIGDPLSAEAKMPVEE